MTILTTTNIIIDSLGTEPKEILGFETDEDLEFALKELMKETSD
ncbi:MULTISPECIES: hypothetical protein [Prochlorococcus]|nr:MULTISPECIES: hypothetical protein [Prochlorococcus]KGG12679.1 hypothetical protein EV05_1896 [Prochlorococcus sp. MIT 0601]